MLKAGCTLAFAWMCQVPSVPAPSKARSPAPASNRKLPIPRDSRTSKSVQRRSPAKARCPRRVASAAKARVASAPISVTWARAVSVTARSAPTATPARRPLLRPPRPGRQSSGRPHLIRFYPRRNHRRPRPIAPASVAATIGTAALIIAVPESLQQLAPDLRARRATYLEGTRGRRQVKNLRCRAAFAEGLHHQPRRRAGVEALHHQCRRDREARAGGLRARCRADDRHGVGARDTLRARL